MIGRTAGEGLALDRALEAEAETVAVLDNAVLASIGFTSLFNASGNPAMSVPLGWSRSGLPLGVQFVAAFGAEATLFRLAGQLETAAPWADRRPPLPA